MSAQGAAGAGDAAQTTTTSEEEPPPTAAATTTTDQKPIGLLGAVLADMKGEAIEEEPQPTAAATADGEEQSAEEKATESKAQGAKGEEGAAPEGEEKSLPVEWPQEAKARVAEEADKRRKRTVERDQEREKRVAAEARAADLEEQLKAAPRVQAMPSAADPLAHVTNEAQLRQMVQTYEELLEEAELHPEGMELPTGTDADGNVKTQHFDAEATAKIRVQAGRILRHAIPAKFAYLQDLRASEEEARTIYPDLFNPQSQLHKDALKIAQGAPEIMRFPDWMEWLGDALTKRAERLAAKAKANGEVNGAAARNPKIAPLLEKKPPIAPGVPKVGGIRGPTDEKLGDVDVDEARKNLRTRGGGDEEARETYIAATLGAGRKRTGGREPAPI